MTCALCGWRDAVTHTELDGRQWPACLHCMAPATAPPAYVQMGRPTIVGASARTQADKNRIRRMQARALGLCTTCLKNDARGKTICAACQERNTERARRRACG